MVREIALRSSRLFQLTLLAAAMAAGGYVRTVLGPLQETLRTALSLSDNQMALLQGPVVGLPVVLTAIPLGLLIDRYSRARLLVLLVGAGFLASLLTASASDFPMLAVTRGIAGLMGASVLPVVMSMASDLYGPGERGRATTTVVIGQVIGNSGAFALGGTLLVASGVDAGGWRRAVVGLSVAMAPIVLLMFALQEPARKSVSIRNPSVRQVWQELRQIQSVIVPLVLGILLAETAIGAMLVWAAPMLSRKFLLPPDRTGTIVAGGMMISGVMGPIVGGALADLCQRTGGPARTVGVLSGLAIACIPLSLFAFVDDPLSASVMLIAALTLIIAEAIMGMALFTIVIPNELRGLCMSLLMAAILLCALAVAPVVVSLLSGALGGLSMIGKALSLVCVGTSVLAATVFAVGRRHLPVDVRA